MNKGKSLSIAMGLFFITVLVLFGLIIINERASDYYLPRVDKKLNNYLTNNYPDIEVIPKKTIYKDGVYKLKVVSKENKNLYFFIIYKNKKISSTYKRDYLEGKTLLTKISNDLKKKISKKVDCKFKIRINKPLNSFSSKVKQKIIKEDSLIKLSIYDVYTDLNVDSLSVDSIYNEIVKLESKFENNNIYPKSYYLTITNKNNIVEAIKINNLSSSIKKDELKTIISDIIDKKESDILNKYDITYKYLN